MSGKELRKLRTSAGLSQAKLAWFLEYERHQIGKWERGTVPIPKPVAEYVKKLIPELIAAGPT